MPWTASSGSTAIKMIPRLVGEFSHLTEMMQDRLTFCSPLTYERQCSPQHMSYKNLNLDRSRILELAANALPGATVEPLVQKGSAHECSILVDGKQSLLHFFFNNDGTTTILWKVGKHHDVSEIAAKHIAEYGVTNPQKSFSLALRGRAPHEVALLIEYLTNDIGATLIKQDDIDFPSHTAYRLQSKEGDAIMIKHYSNATGSSFNLVPDERNRLNCGETCDAIQRCYSLFSKHRHGLFHVDEVVAATRIIQSRQEALDLVNVVLAEIENSYILIAQKRFGP